MPQLQLPVFPEGMTSITEDLGFELRQGQVVYFHGLMPVFQHAQNDLRSFRMFTSQLIANGTVRQRDIVKAFQVPLATVKRYFKVHRERGAAGFFLPPRHRSASVLTAEVLPKAQLLLDQGASVPEVSSAIGVLGNTLHKAIRAGRLHAFKKLIEQPEHISSKSERSAIDSTAPMGYGTTRTLERVAAAMGELEAAPIVFHPAVDIPQGGVLLALPALLAVGLLRHREEVYALPRGFYGVTSIFLLLALMALTRIRSIEQLRYESAGEWGNLLGLDRVPEVRTLRSKLTVLCDEQGRAARWNAMLAETWIGENEAKSESCLAFYIDGHVRVYHGEQTKLPLHYVPRERFSMRATVDYWVNALDGQPFCYFNQAVDHGLVQAMRGDVLPWLETQVSVSEEHRQRMAADPRMPRFTVVFDREGYSPDLFIELQKKQIAVLTYHRYPDPEDWDEREFQQQAVRLATGETVQMKLAERGTHIGKRPGLWVREVRRLGADGHQISMISTNFVGDAKSQTASLLARWSQENFFKYMRHNFGLDALVQYGTEEMPATATAVNPAWQEQNRQLRRKYAEKKTLQTQQQNAGLTQPLSEATMRLYEQHEGKLQGEIEQVEQTIKQLQQQRKDTPRQIPVHELPEPDRFTRLRTERKYFLDTIKMIAYRAETSMASTVREKLKRSDDARALLRQIYDTEVDLQPDQEAKTLTVRLHHLTQAAHDAAVRYLCEELTATETIFPGTDLRLIYTLGSS